MLSIRQGLCKNPYRQHSGAHTDSDSDGNLSPSRKAVPLDLSDISIGNCAGGASLRIVENEALFLYLAYESCQFRMITQVDRYFRFPHCARV